MILSPKNDDNFDTKIIGLISLSKKWKECLKILICCISSHLVLVVRFKHLNLGLWVECYTTVLLGHNYVSGVPLFLAKKHLSRQTFVQQKFVGMIFTNQSHLKLQLIMTFVQQNGLCFQLCSIEQHICNIVIDCRGHHRKCIKIHNATVVYLQQKTFVLTNIVTFWRLHKD